MGRGANGKFFARPLKTLTPDAERTGKKQHRTPTQVLLTAAVGVLVGALGGFDLGYTFGHDAGRRAERIEENEAAQ